MTRTICLPRGRHGIHPGRRKAQSSVGSEDSPRQPTPHHSQFFADLIIREGLDCGTNPGIDPFISWGDAMADGFLHPVHP